MELYGCVKGLTFLKGEGVMVEALTTDRHASIKGHMKKKEPNTLHYFDPWHIAKEPDWLPCTKMKTPQGAKQRRRKGTLCGRGQWSRPGRALRLSAQSQPAPLTHTSGGSWKRLLLAATSGLPSRRP
ncbi:unnamed protein product [Ixodes hexagonus]